MSTHDEQPRDRSRRAFIGGVGKVAVANAIGAPAIHVRAAEQPIVVASWGGALAKAYKEAWIEPFTKETGIPVVLAEGPDLAKLKAQVTTNNGDWDVVDLPGATAAAAAKAGYFVPFDRSVIDGANFLSPTGVPELARIYYFISGVVWDPTRSPAGKHPTDFVGYFDAAKYPGARAMRARISEVLEMALVASGVPPNKLYPLDVERGFKMLDKIKPHVRKWVTETAQMTNLVVTKEVDFSVAYTSRFLPMLEGKQPIDMSKEQMLIGSSYFGIPKSSRNKAAAAKFVAFCLRPDRQAQCCSAIASAPSVKGALELMSPSARAWIPNVNDARHIVVNDQYWADNFDALQSRMKEWMLS